MKNLDQLFIRACKSKNARTRLKSVYNRFYFGKCIVHQEPFINTILLDLAQKLYPITPSKLYSGMMDEAFFSNNDYHSNILSVMINHFRFAEKTNLEGLTTPAFFRNKDS